VLWDIVVDKRYQGLGYGKIIVSKLLEHKALNKVEKIYLMTTHQKGFYEQIGFKLENNQNLMIHNAERNIF
jgi:N-acetylglutamate synthase-like GNAT family acetyltransferase